MSDGSRSRITRSKSHARGVEAGRLVETVNSLTAQDFFDKYLSASVRAKLGTACEDKDLRFVLKDADSLGNTLHSKCFALIEQSSQKDYAESELSWKPVSKKREMLLPDMKYLICGEKLTLETGEIRDERAGFISFMVTYEDGIEVIYIYEIHLNPSIQGQGLGKLLMDLVESVGRQVGVVKSMLTVFKSNDKALRWYQHLGYTTDQFSPAPKRLRNGIVKEPKYLILSKHLK